MMKQRPKAGKRLARSWAAMGLFFLALGCMLLPVDGLGEALFRGLVVLACAGGGVALEAE